MTNPLIAPVKDSTTALSGIPLLEDAETLKQGIESKNWASVAIGAVGTALDVLTAVMDPFGAILAAGVGWLMEHVGPLKEALNALTGNADEIKSQSETWTNVAKELEGVSTELKELIKKDLESWQGEAADAYRKRAEDTSALIASAQKGSEGAASGVKTAGEVVAAVRTLVRDTIADLVGHLISWALQVVFTLGIGMAWVVPQVVTAVAKTASTIAKVTAKLVKALKALVPLLKKAGTLFEDAAKSLKNLKSGKGGATHTPKDINVKSDKPKGGSKDNESTSASGDHSGGGNGGNTHTSGDHNNAPKDPKNENQSPGGGADRGGEHGGTGERGGSNSEKRPDENKTDPKNKNDETKSEDKEGCGDPVDVVSGEVMMTVADLLLPGVPEQALERTHLSSYRTGRWFGPTWTSTVDQRLELGGDEIRYYSADGMVLTYPRTAGTDAVFPVAGPRLPLTRDGETYVLEDAPNRRTTEFAPVAGERAGVLPVVAIDVERGPRITVEHGPDGAPSVVRHSDGPVVRLTATATRITGIEVVDPDGGPAVKVASFGYNPQGHLARVVNSSGLPETYDYDLEGRIVGWQDRTGTWYRYGYDRTGRCVRTAGPRGFFSGSFVYDLERRITTYTDSLGAKSEYHYNANKQIVRIVDQTGGEMTSVWDGDGLLAQRTFPDGTTASFTHDRNGVLTAVTRGDGSVVHVWDDGVELTLRTRAADGSWVTRVHRGEDRPNPYREPIGVSGSLSYQGETVREAGKDASAESSARVERDIFGRPRTVANRSGERIRLGWTVEGAETLRILPSGARETRRYDADGHEIGRTDRAGFSSSSEYGVFGLLTATTDTTGARTEYAYDTELRLASVTNSAGLKWTYRRDAAGRVVEETDFDGRVLRFAYDRGGRPVSTIDGNGEETRYEYDELGNLKTQASPSLIITYRHDELGNLVYAEADGVELHVVYDEYGTVVSETTDGRTVTRTRGGGVVTRRTPAGVESRWEFDRAGRPESLQIGAHSVQFTHDDGGREIRRVVDGQVVVSQVFDADDNLVEQSAGAGRRRFSYRLDGLLTGVADETGTTRIELDAAGRVVQLHGPRRGEQYRYDAAGNLVASAAGPHTYRGNTVRSAGPAVFEHDRQGRMVSRREGDRIWRYVWGGQDRLTSLTTPEGDVWQYRYDPLGRRVSKRRLVAGNTAEYWEFTWSGTKLVEQSHVDAAGNRRVTTWEHHPDGDRPILQIDQPATVDEVFRTIVTDLVGTPAELLDEAGRTVWRAGGAGLWHSAAADAPTPLRFPGQYADAESGLYYNVYRYYDPSTGRYLSQDPLGLAPAANPVAYVGNPLAACDPLGLAPTGSGTGKCGKNKGGVDDRAGGGNQAGRQPGDRTKPAHYDENGLSFPGEKYGDNMKVYVDSHQNKHQTDRLNMPFDAKTGTKYPGGVHEEWHRDVFSHKAAEIAKTKTDPIDKKVNDAKADYDAKKEDHDDAKWGHDDRKREWDAKVDKAFEKQKNNDKDAWNKLSDDEKIQREKAFRDRADKAFEDKPETKDFRQKEQEMNDAKQKWDDAGRERDNTPSLQYGKTDKDPDIKNIDTQGSTYDVTTTWKPKPGREHTDDPYAGEWNVTYHSNPNAKNWWETDGAGIRNDNPALGLPNRTR
ncbi:RHS repeat-associated core domain-containing protein [Amycolatopsis sp. WGS_07]|uniref:RHS repeat-associated core domain-containing protein n=1 Tax=Amycolatopsis sp. WGS_07 TaxID=3076764 RepID=UPI003873C39E